MTNRPAVIFKIVPRLEWQAVKTSYVGSAHDLADGFLHFSTGPQLADTLKLYYAEMTDLLLVAVDASRVSPDLKYEYAASRQSDFPHLFAPLPLSAVLWARPIAKDTDGQFSLPDLNETI